LRQGQGLIKTPEEAQLTHDDDPLHTPYMLAYVLRHAAKGLPEPFAENFRSYTDAGRRAELIGWLQQEIERLS
jgi:hypothetical protein